MTTTLWILLAVAALLIVGYFVTMRYFFRQGQELDKKIDMSKMRAWKDDD